MPAARAPAHVHRGGVDRAVQVGARREEIPIESEPVEPGSGEPAAAAANVRRPDRGQTIHPTMPGAPQGGAPGRQKQQGGMPNVQQMMAQVQQMQQDMEAAQEQLKHETVSASAGGGMVTVQVTGDLRVTSMTIDPEAVDPEDVEHARRHGHRGRQRGAARRPGAGREQARRRDRRPRPRRSRRIGTLPPGGLPGL